ncbi:MAG: hypothetical protein ACD_23C01086G0001 [uncultured bacterium]|nr:MAG: hypothetical protein ACD_23C01086G0001 [uncultured bacterium]
MISFGAHKACQDTGPIDLCLFRSKTTNTVSNKNSLPRLMAAIDNPADAAAKETMATRAFIRFEIIESMTRL